MADRLRDDYNKASKKLKTKRAGEQQDARHEAGTRTPGRTSRAEADAAEKRFEEGTRVPAKPDRPSTETAQAASKQAPEDTSASLNARRKRAAEAAWKKKVDALMDKLDDNPGPL